VKLQLEIVNMTATRLALYAVVAQYTI